MPAKKQPLSLKSRGINTPDDTPVQEETTQVTPIKAVANDVAEPIKRLTLDMPQSLHTKLKIKAMEEGTTMAKMLKGWINEKIGE